MPIYEYRAKESGHSCDHCKQPFEVLQGLSEESLSVCPQCRNPVVKLISWCRGAVVEENAEDSRVRSSIRGYEQAGMWSHAAELADKHASNTKDASLKSRALDNYKKAGYDLKS